MSFIPALQNSSVTKHEKKAPYSHSPSKNRFGGAKGNTYVFMKEQDRERTEENESKRTVRASPGKARGRRSCCAHGRPEAAIPAAGLLTTACGPDEAGRTAVAAEFGAGGTRLPVAARPSCRLSVTRPRAQRSRLARFRPPPPCSEAWPHCGQALVHQAQDARAPGGFRWRAHQLGSGPRLRCWNPRPRLEEGAGQPEARPEGSP